MLAAPDAAVTEPGEHQACLFGWNLAAPRRSVHVGGEL